MVGSEGGRDRRDEIRMGEAGKRVYWESAGVVRPSRLSWTVGNPAVSTTPEMLYYRRG